VGITKIQVSCKMDEANVLFLDWLVRQAAPLPASRSWWNNECLTVVRIFFRQGHIGLPIAGMQRIPRIADVIPSFPSPSAADGEGLGLLPPDVPNLQAQFNFFSLRAAR
jgi:hypothetical protein